MSMSMTPQLLRTFVFHRNTAEVSKCEKERKSMQTNHFFNQEHTPMIMVVLIDL
jgi:hypothetical protein